MTTTGTHINALVVEGGAMRSIFSAGLLDGFLAQEFKPFDFVIGVSAGSLNLINYLTGRQGNGLSMYLDAAANKDFMSYWRFLTGGDLLDLDWVYQKLAETCASSGLDFDNTMLIPMYVCVTSIRDGQPKYIRVTAENCAMSVQASCALPVIYRRFPLIDEIPVVDGGIADGIPVQKAISLGATRIMVIRSRPYTYRKRDSLWHKYLRWKLKTYPALVDTMRNRISIFNDTLRIVRQPPPGIRILEICPPDSFTSGRFDRRDQQLRQGYAQGFQATQQTIEDWQSVIEIG